MSVWFVLLLQTAALPATLPRLTPSCRDAADGHDDADADGDAIVVCGDRRDRYRLPLPVDPADAADGPVRGEGASGVAALTARTPCGPFAGQRMCRKTEAARYGYGEGRDPVTVLGRLGRKLLDPDADPGEPARRP